MSQTSALPFEASPDSICQPPQPGELIVDRLVRVGTFIFAWSIIALVTFIVLKIAWTARPAAARFGFSLLSATEWDLNRDAFGLLPAIWGTLYSSILGVAIGTFFGLSIAIVLSQDFLPESVET